MAVALDREQGLLKLKRALPMPPLAYLLGKMCMAMLFSVLVMLSLVVAAVATRDLGLSAWQLASVVAISVVGTLPFCAIGLFIGSRVAGRTAPAFVNLAYLPMVYLSGLFFPLPPSIQNVVLVSPAFHINQLALQAAGIPRILPPAWHLAALLGVTVLFAGLAVRRVVTMG
jgi:ABC-2 type transport system permease protein